MYTYDIVYREERGVLNLQSSDDRLEWYLILFVKRTYNEFVKEKVHYRCFDEINELGFDVFEW